MMNEWITPAICYFFAIIGPVITGISQILLKKQANNTNKTGFFGKFLNLRVITAYGLLMLNLATNQIALIHVPMSVLPCFTATSFFWIYLLGYLILKERLTPRKIAGVVIILLGIVISRL